MKEENKIKYFLYSLFFSMDIIDKKHFSDR